MPTTDQRTAIALERIADALEAQAAANEAQAAFARMLTKGISPDDLDGGGFEDYRDGADGFTVLSGGEWRQATMAEEQEIAAMIQKRRMGR